MLRFTPNFRTIRARESFARRSPRRYFGFEFLVFLFLVGLFSPHVAAATGQDTWHAPIPAVAPGPSFAIADFDGDQRPDLASVEGGQIGSSSANYRIQLHLTAFNGPQAIQVVGPPGGLRIEARDVNGDHAVDLVLTTAWLKQPVAVLLNNGHGGFSHAEPSEFPGAFSDSKRNWGSSSNQASETVCIPSQPRSGIFSGPTNLLDVRRPTESVRASHSGFLLDSFLIACAGRAPPSEVSYL